MVLILDDNLEYVVHAWSKVGVLDKKKVRFVTTLDLIKCRSNQMPSTDQMRDIAPYTCAPIFELPSDISTCSMYTFSA